MDEPEDKDPRDFFVKSKPHSVRPMKMTDAWRFEAMEAVIEAATVVLDIAKAMNNPAAHIADDSMLTDALVGLDASLAALKAG